MITSSYIIIQNLYPATINSKIVEEITEEKPPKCSSTNKIYQNISKENQLPEDKI